MGKELSQLSQKQGESLALSRNLNLEFSMHKVLNIKLSSTASVNIR